VTPQEVDAAYRQDLANFVTLQQEAGLDFFADGLLRWQDIFRPLAEAAGVHARILTRWFDNNAFFRAPEVDGPLKRLEAVQAIATGILPGAMVPSPRVATLPSPYMFSRAAVTTGDRNTLMLDLARDLLRPAAEQFVAAGCRLIHLQEPWLGFYGIDSSDRAPLGHAIETLTVGLDADVILHVYFGDAAPYLDWLRKLPVHAVGVDLVETDVSALGRGWEIGLLAGCIDGRSSVVEPAAQTAAAIRQIAERAEPPVLYVSTSCDLQLLPRDLAVQKVRALGAAMHQLRELVA
jgi:5-methyltetrahydropteroyltriglutamate--homocysteine methyltransferase